MEAEIVAIFSAETINESRNLHLQRFFNKNTIGVKKKVAKRFSV